ncbi:hypothetical protein F442_10090 [Phytophthora nicotianae P10297]|uniref:Phytotoxin PcF domain-containing protein n=3 Tax=Phytophthora nicotianae TaxID=4792 RepID=V9F127_PHYNI|nr:hypothetical protein F443_10185 [Phytophthora nicotianae P1569]ETL91722.1 hypothetical protein L917_09792 [Phytophthora nicotianae]ETM44979.1 hypothetical protein L914_09849 [Phytophthora nicotianae]ETP43046.1 hypothetical protein F442_10090 [Phytophthora nicotianae P10297]
MSIVASGVSPSLAGCRTHLSSRYYYSTNTMNFKTWFAFVFAAVVATVATAEESSLSGDPQYCQGDGCPPLYCEANIQISQACRNDIAVKGGTFEACCKTKCGASA